MCNNSKVMAIAKKCDKTLLKQGHYSSSTVQENLDTLLETGSVIIGVRIGNCKADTTLLTYRVWSKLIRKMQALGYNITIKSIPQTGKYSNTSSEGGYWHEFEYRIER